MPADGCRLVHRCARSAQLVRGDFFPPPALRLASTARRGVVSYRIWGAGVVCGSPSPEKSVQHTQITYAQGSGTLLHVLLDFVCIFLFLTLALEQSRCTLPPPPRRPHPPTSSCRFYRTGEKREQENKTEKEMQNNLRPCFPADPLRPSCDREASSAKTGCGSHH